MCAEIQASRRVVNQENVPASAPQSELTGLSGRRAAGMASSISHVPVDAQDACRGSHTWPGRRAAGVRGTGKGRPVDAQYARRASPSRPGVLPARPGWRTCCGRRAIRHDRRFDETIVGVHRSTSLSGIGTRRGGRRGRINAREGIGDGLGPPIDVCTMTPATSCEDSRSRIAPATGGRAATGRCRWSTEPESRWARAAGRAPVVSSGESSRSDRNWSSEASR